MSLLRRNSVPQNSLLLMAVMSLYAKATLTDDGETAQRVALPLAECMMSKFLEEGQINTEHECTLFILILFRMNAHMKAYQALLDVKKTGVQWTTGLYSTLMLACLIKTEQTEKLREYLEELIQENKEDLKFYRQYVQSFGASIRERVTYFLKSKKSAVGKTTKRDLNGPDK